jgi:S-adenosylmethionine:tRNA ribosyltransferase-isomerase
VLSAERGVRVVDGLLTGFHEPRATHLAMLEAIAGRAHLERAYAAALAGRYLWHEFGDLHLILPGRAVAPERLKASSGLSGARRWRPRRGRFLGRSAPSE